MNTTPSIHEFSRACREQPAAVRGQSVNRTGSSLLHVQHQPLAQSGLSIIELMISLLISSLILVGLVQIFSANRATYIVDEGIARLQENARFATEFLARDIRMAGSMGCLGNIPFEKLKEKTINYVDGGDGSEGPFDFTAGAIRGFDYIGTSPGDTYTQPNLYPATLASSTDPTLNTSLVAAVAPGSDVLVLRMMDSVAANLVSPYNDAAQIFVSTPNTFEAGQVLMVTDCNTAAIFQATGVSNSGANIAHAVGGNPGNICPNWGVGGCPGSAGRYGAGSQVARFKVMAYYISNGASGGPSLFRRTWDEGVPVSTELVEGIENMQILYGVDTDQDRPPNGSRFNPDMFVPGSAMPADPATGEPDWSRVVSVRISLLVSGNVSSTQSGQSDTQLNTATYSVGGVTIDPPDDRRQRRVFTQTIDVRNR